MKRLHLIIKGEVQGVFFRHSTKQEADKLGLKGWARNNSDRSVEVVAEGKKETLLKLLEFCKSGPGSSTVTSVDEEWLEATEEFKGFTTR